MQVRSPRSIVKSLAVRPVSRETVRPLIEREHYLHSMPAAACACFGVYLDGALAGAVVLTPGARMGHRVLEAGAPEHVVTLARLWLSDKLPPNSESRVLGVVLRSLRRTTGWKLVLSYADPAAGHVGTIYQAAGWFYLGETAATSYLDLGDGRLQHPRSVSVRLGSNSVRHLRATGVAASRRMVEGKHRYAYILAPGWRWRLRAAALPYPRTVARPARRPVWAAGGDSP